MHKQEIIDLLTQALDQLSEGQQHGAETTITGVIEALLPPPLTDDEIMRVYHAMKAGNLMVKKIKPATRLSAAKINAARYELLERGLVRRKQSGSSYRWSVVGGKGDLENLMKGVHVLQVCHDDWCQTLKTGNGNDCNCSPDEYVVDVSDMSSEGIGKVMRGEI